MVLKELILTADPAEWINLINFKKLNYSSSINFTCQKINNKYSCNFTYMSFLPSLFLLVGRSILHECTDFLEI